MSWEIAPSAVACLPLFFLFKTAALGELCNKRNIRGGIRGWNRRADLPAYLQARVHATRRPQLYLDTGQSWSSTLAQPGVIFQVVQHEKAKQVHMELWQCVSHANQQSWKKNITPIKRNIDFNNVSLFHWCHVTKLGDISIHRGGKNQWKGCCPVNTLGVDEWQRKGMKYKKKRKEKRGLRVIEFSKRWVMTGHYLSELLEET